MESPLTYPLKLSVIVPVLNESAHIERMAATLLALDSTPKEVLLTDGGSADDTRERIRSLAAQNPDVRLVENPDRYVSQGFNRAYRVARGEYVALVGAHAEYPEHYFERCIAAIESGRCDACGGFLIQRGKTPMGCAIAHAMSSRFGVGDTAFRTTPVERYVDSVAFAVYSRRIFERCGLMDEELVRNQDDEFHYRLNAAGFRMLMLPDLRVAYFVRNTLSALWRQYEGYGFYKPLVIAKVRSGLRLRHLVPSAFVLYLLSLPAAFLTALWAIPLALYALLAVWFSRGLGLGFWRGPAAFVVLHVAYGWGFWRGLWYWRARFGIPLNPRSAKKKRLNPDPPKKQDPRNAG